MKVWITLYALTTGVFKAEVQTPTEQIPNIICVPGFARKYFHEHEWHVSEQDAVEAVEQMVSERRVKLVKELARLQNFDPHVAVLDAKERT